MDTQQHKVQIPPQDIFGQIGLDSISKEQKLELMEVFGAEFAGMLAEEIDANLTPEQQVELDRLDEEGDENKVNEFLTQSVPNFDQIYARALDRFLGQTKMDVSSVKQMVKKMIDDTVNKK